MNPMPTDTSSIDEACGYDVETWPRDFDVRMSRAEQQELLRSDECATELE